MDRSQGLAYKESIDRGVSFHRETLDGRISQVEMGRLPPRMRDKMIVRVVGRPDCLSAQPCPTQQKHTSKPPGAGDEKTDKLSPSIILDHKITATLLFVHEGQV